MRKKSVSRRRRRRLAMEALCRARSCSGADGSRRPPDPALMNLSRAAPSYFRLVPEDLAGSPRPCARARTRRPARRRRKRARSSPPAIDASSATSPPAAPRRCRPTRTSTPSSNVCSRRTLGPLGGKLRAGPLAQRPDGQRSAPLSARTAPARSWRGCSTSPARLAGAGRGACRDAWRPASPICSRRSRSRSAISCWRMPRRCCATPTG